MEAVEAGRGPQHLLPPRSHVERRRQQRPRALRPRSQPAPASLSGRAAPRAGRATGAGVRGDAATSGAGARSLRGNASPRCAA